MHATDLRGGGGGAESGGLPQERRNGYRPKPGAAPAECGKPNAGVICFANDGKGTFAAAQTLQAAEGGDLTWDGEASAIGFGDWDGDGHLDLVVAIRQVVVHRGAPNGFAAVPLHLGMAASALTVADWDGDRAVDLLTVQGSELVVRIRAGGRLNDPQRLAMVEGDSGQARLAVADWNGDGKLDVLLGENVELPAPPVDPGRAADDAERRRLAERLLVVIADEREKLDESRPPLGDAAAMERRLQRRAELDRWAAGPRGVLGVLATEQQVPRLVGAMRVLLQR